MHLYRYVWEKNYKQKPLNVHHLRASGLQNAVRVFRAHALHDPGPQPLFDETDVRQQLGKLPLQTGDFLQQKHLARIRKQLIWYNKLCQV